MTYIITLHENDEAEETEVAAYAVSSEKLQEALIARVQVAWPNLIVRTRKAQRMADIPLTPPQ